MAKRLTSQTLTGVAGIDATELQGLGIALDRAAPELRKELHKGLLRAAQVIKNDAVLRAAQHSTSIPRTIKLSSTKSAVTIKAGGKGNVLARLYEIGNLEKGRKRNVRRGSSKKTGVAGQLIFRHPGRPRADGSPSAWAEQARYPFLAPALEANRDELVANTERAVNDVTRKIRVDRSGSISILEGI